MNQLCDSSYLNESVVPMESKVLKVEKEELAFDVKIENVSFDDEILDESGELTSEEYSCGNCKSQSVKSERRDDSMADEESKYNINQIKDEGDEVWLQQDFSTAWNCPSIKIEKNEDYISESEFTDDNMKETIAIMSSKPTKNLPQKDDLALKSDSIHTKSKKYKCDFCDYSSLRRYTIVEHTKSVHLKLNIHKCNLCDFSSTYKSTVKHHMNTFHLKLKNHSCELCDYKTSQKSVLQMHIKAVHLKLRNHKCHFCDYSSTFKNNLRNHIKENHFNIRNYKCHICDYSTTQNAVLQRHIKSVHLKLKDQKCDVCSYSCSRKSSLLLHIRSVHLKLKKYKCEICDYRSSWKPGLEKHKKSAHSKDFERQ
ncbi:hypothetical protein WA026_013598 [Henosepilachna vigintioctopunctata]|uniref:C2H2-type domain-containing protein n=1 Tax=Henosepilachna vigintioctopunctata TaxID=420089 RepID=A0AAW1VGJ7_9CUCU